MRRQKKNVWKKEVPEVSLKKKNQTLVVKIEERECSGTVHAVIYEVDKSKIGSNHSGLTHA